MGNVKRAVVQLLLALCGIAREDHGVARTTTHLQFYMHDTVTPTARNPASAALVVRGPGDLINRFGDMYIIDDPLREGPGMTSPTIGRAQGFYYVASQALDALMLSANMVFTAGKQNGSSITVLGRDAIFNEVRELPVMGGTGMFRGATGYAQIRTHFFNISNNNAVLKVDMFITV